MAIKPSYRRHQGPFLCQPYYSSQQGPHSLQEATGAIQPSCRRQQGPFNHPEGGNCMGTLNNPTGVNRGHSTILRDASGAIQSSYRRKQGPFNHPAGGNRRHTIYKRQQGPFNHPTEGNRGHLTILREIAGAIRSFYRRQQ